MSTINLSKSQIETIICYAYQQALLDVASTGVVIKNADYVEDMNECADIQSTNTIQRYKKRVDQM